MAEATVAVDLVLNTADALKQVGQVTGAFGALEKIFPRITSAVKGIASSMARFGLAVEGVKSAAAIVTGAFGALGAQMDAIYARSDLLNQASLFGVSIDEAKQLQSTLSDVKTEMEALALATKLGGFGFSKTATQQFGNIVNVIAATTGQAKAAVEKSILSGNLSVEQLAGIGKSSLDLAAIFAEAEAKLQRPLDAADKARIITEQWGGEMQKLEAQLGKLGASNPFNDMKMNIRSISEQIFNSLMPSIREMGEWLRNNRDAIVLYTKATIQFFAYAFQALGELATSATKSFSGVYNTIGSVWAKLPNLAKKVVTMIAPTAVLSGTLVGKTVESFKEAWASKGGIAKLLAGDFDEAGKAGKANEEKRAAIRKAAYETFQKTTAQRESARRSAQLKIEAAQETTARQKQARAMIRNFDESSLKGIAALGARDSSAVASKFSEIIATYKVLSSQDSKFMTRGGKAAQIMASALDAGSAVMTRILAQEEQRTNALKASMSLLKSEQAIYAARNEALNDEKSTTAAITTASRVVAVLERDRSAIGATLLTRAKEFLVALRAQAEERKRLLSIRVRSLEIDREAEGAGLAESAYRKETDALQRIADLRMEIAKQRGPVAETTIISADAEKRIAAVKGEINSLIISADALAAKISIGAYVGESEQIARRELASVNAVIQARLTEIALIRESRDTQITSLTVAGRLTRAYADQAAKLTEITANQAKTTIDSMISGVGGVVSSVFETMVSQGGISAGAVGKLFLDVLAGAAAQMGAYFLAAGTAQMFVPPYTGAGAIAGGLALLALAGTMKGIGSLISAGSSPSSAAGAASRAPKSPDRLPGQSTHTGQAPVQYFVSISREPWDARTDEQRNQSLMRWMDRTSRTSGTPNPFDAARASRRRP